MLVLGTLAALGGTFFSLRFAIRAHRWIAANRGLTPEATLGGYVRHALAEWVDGFEKLPPPPDSDDTYAPEAIETDQTASPD